MPVKHLEHRRRRPRHEAIVPIDEADDLPAHSHKGPVQRIRLPRSGSLTTLSSARANRRAIRRPVLRGPVLEPPPHRVPLRRQTTPASAGVPGAIERGDGKHQRAGHGQNRIIARTLMDQPHLGETQFGPVLQDGGMPPLEGNAVTGFLLHGGQI